MVALALRLYGQYGDPTYDVAVTRVTELADDHVTVEFAVTVPTGGAADCTVRALAYSGAEVGRARVEVRAAPGERQVVTSYRLATSQRPYHADVPGCGPATSR
jgi:hypothetical protein